MRAVVATHLGLPYEATPEISGLAGSATFWSDWSRWLRRRLRPTTSHPGT